MKEKILVIEDDRDLLQLITYNLEKSGYMTSAASDGRIGLGKALGESPDLIILDIMLPSIDGLEICKALRKDQALSGVPIIFLTAKAEEIDRIIGFEIGADDYVTKPFSPRELIARIKALLRRVQTKAHPSSRISLGNLSIDTEKHHVLIDGQEISLSALEFKLLHYFASNEGKVLARDHILDRVWGERYVTDRTVDVHVRRLREKIEADPENPKYITTIRGFGYKFVCAP